jgi:hypothetical protein
MIEREWLTSADPAAMLEWRTHISWLKTFPPTNISDRKLRLFACAGCRSMWHLLMDERSRRAVEVAERYADGEATGQELYESNVDADHAPCCCYGVPWNRDNAPHRLAAWASFEDARNAAITTVQVDCGQFAVDAKTQADILRDLIGNPFRPVVLPVGPKCERCGDSPVKGRLNPDGLGLNWLPCKKCNGTGHQPCPYITPFVIGIAQVAYDNRNTDGTLESDRLMVLSDALEDAGFPTHETLTTSCHNCNAEGFVQDAYDRGMHFLCAKCDGTKRREIEVPHPLLTHLRSPGPHWRGCWALDLILEKE